MGPLGIFTLDTKRTPFVRCSCGSIPPASSLIRRSPLQRLEHLLSTRPQLVIENRRTTISSDMEFSALGATCSGEKRIGDVQELFDIGLQTYACPAGCSPCQCRSFAGKEKNRVWMVSAHHRHNQTVISDNHESSKYRSKRSASSATGQTPRLHCCNVIFEIASSGLIISRECCVIYIRTRACGWSALRLLIWALC